MGFTATPLGAIAGEAPGRRARRRLLVRHGDRIPRARARSRRSDIRRSPPALRAAFGGDHSRPRQPLLECPARSRAAVGMVPIDAAARATVGATGKRQVRGLLGQEPLAAKHPCDRAGHGSRDDADRVPCGTPGPRPGRLGRRPCGAGCHQPGARSTRSLATTPFDAAAPAAKPTAGAARLPGARPAARTALTSCARLLTPRRR